MLHKNITAFWNVVAIYGYTFVVKYYETLFLVLQWKWHVSNGEQAVFFLRLCFGAADTSIF